MARTTTGSSTHGTLYELDAIAAVVIGGTLLIGGRGTIVGTVLGVLIFTTLANVFTLNNLSSSAQAVAKGVIIVARRAAAAAAGHRRPASGAAPTSAGRRRRPGHRRGGGARRHRPGAAPAAHARLTTHDLTRPGSAPPDGPPGSAAAPPDHLATEPGRQTRGENMSATRQRGYRRLTTTAVALVGAGALRRRLHRATPRTSSGSSGGGNNAASDNDEPGEKVTIGFSAPAADHGWMAGITNAAKAEAEKYDDVDLKVAEGTNDVSTADQPGRDLHQRQGRRHRAAAVRRRRADAGRAQGDAGRHPGHQRRPRVRQPVRRPRHDPRRQLRHGRLGRHLHLPKLERQARTRSSPRSPASTRCR